MTVSEATVEPQLTPLPTEHGIEYLALWEVAFDVTFQEWLALDWRGRIKAEMRAYDRVLDSQNPRGAMRFTRGTLTTRYSWAIPTPEALDVIAERSPILEIGAGTGYWAYLLRDRGVDVVAFDLAVKDGRTTSHWHNDLPLFTQVKRGGQAKAKLYPERTLMLCWPPHDQPMANEALRNYEDAGGQTLVYIGEYHGVTGDEAFRRRVDQNWLEVREVEIPQWPGMHDFLGIYERR